MKNGWFNPVNTLVYAVILILAVYLVYKYIIKRMNIAIDSKFLYAIIPFIFWAATTRVLHDAAFAGVLKGSIGRFYSMNIFPTPGSYFITFTLALAVLVLSLAIQKRFNKEYWKVMIVIGIALCSINLYLLPFRTIISAYYLFPIFSLCVFFVYLMHMIIKKLGIKFWGKWDSFIVLSHLLDATSTFVAIEYFGYAEQHVLPRFLIGIFGPWIMFPLKLIFVIPALCLFNKEIKDNDFRNFLKMVLLVLGLAPGLRDTIRLLVMV